MPAPRSPSSGGSEGSGGRKSSSRSGAQSGRASAGAPKRATTGAAKRTTGGARSKRATNTGTQSKRTASGASKRATTKRNGAGSGTPSSSAAQSSRGSSGSIGEQLANSIIKPFDLVLISRERIQQTLDEAAERGRVTRGDANELVLELVKRGRQQTDDLLKDIERLLGRGRDQIGSAGKRVRGVEPVDRLVRSADRARRTVGVGPSFPILGYDELTAGQVEQRLAGLKPADLRKVRDYELRHANRKLVLEAIERSL